MDDQDYPGLDVHAVAEVYRENKRLHKLFSDAGEGQYNVLALVDHYQDEMIKAHREVRRLRAVPEQLIAMVEARAKRAREKADSKDPKKEVYAAIADAEACSLESMAEWLRAFMAAKDGEG